MAAAWGVTALLACVMLPHLGHALNSIHRHMSEAELRSVFQVEHHSQVPEYELVHVHSVLKRHVRRVDDDSGGGGDGRDTPPPGLEAATRNLRISAFGRDLHLTLQRADGLFKGDMVKMWTAEGNRSEPHTVQYTELPQDDADLGQVYQDEGNLAALLLHRDRTDGELLVEGTIGHDLVVKPVPERVRQHLDSPAPDDDEMFLDQDGEDLSQDVAIDTGFPLRMRRDVRSKHHHIVYKRSVPESGDMSDYAFMEPDHLAKRFRSKRSISKREAPYIIYPEILVIVDYDGYRLHGGDNVQIKRYFVSFWNGVDLRYKLLKGPKIRISIAGIIISRGRDATPYLERNRVGRDAIDSAAALTDMGKYLFRERRLPVYDIAVAVTKLDMCRRQYPNDVCNKGTAGFAYVGGACVVNKRLEKVNSVAIIEDTGGFSGIIVGAHEVGHLLGAVHDGSPPPSYLGGPGAEKCRWEDGYIMSDLRHTEKGFKWSSCSISSFHHFLNGDTATCLYNAPHEDESLPRVLPGKLLTLDAQCRKDRGTSACFKDDRVCAQLFCFDSGSGYCVAYRPAAEGSPCGDGQYCLNGRCVAEHENIIPDYSQNTPAYLRRSDAVSAATQARPVYATFTNSTTQRSSWDEFWSTRKNSTTPYPPSSTVRSPFHAFSQYFTVPTTTVKSYYNPYSTTLNQYYTSTVKPAHTYKQYTFSTTRNPYDFSHNFKSTTVKPSDEGYTTSTKNPYYEYNKKYIFSSTKNPYDFSDLRHTSTKSPYDFGNHITTKRDQYHPSEATTAKPLFKYPYGGYNAFTSSSTAKPSQAHYFSSSATQNEPVFVNITISETPFSQAGDTECRDRATNISGSMTCQEFLSRYGYQYCNYRYMQRNCCASQRDICPRSRRK